MKMGNAWIWIGMFTLVAVAGSFWLRAGDSPPASANGPGTTKITHVDPAGAEALLKDRGVVVLDIRTPAEYSAGHLAGAVNVDFNGKDFETRLRGLDKTKVYLVHCASGRRSQLSLAQFKLFGFEKVCHLDGGIKAWEKEKKPVEK